MQGKEGPKILDFPISRIETAFETGSDVEIARALIDVMRQAFGHIVHSEGAFYAWTGSHWASLQDAELRRLVHPFNGAAVTKGRKDECLKLTKSRIDGALHEAAAMLDQQGFFSSPAEGVNCSSGLIRIFADGPPISEAHDPLHGVRHCLPSRYSGLASCSPPEGSLLATLLAGCFAGDDDADEKISLIAEIAGAVAMGIGTRLAAPKCIVMIGESAGNGKSQFLDMLKGLVPAEAVSSITPQQMGHEQYRAILAGKLLNVSDELGLAAILSDAFKAIITGEAVTAKTVYRPPFSFRPMAQNVFATNRLPPFSDGMDRGVRRRLLPLVFDRTIPLQERIPDIGKKIAAEEADILLPFAIGGARRLLKQRMFTVPRSSREALARWFLTSDPVMAFLQDEDAVFLSGAKTDRVTSKAAYAAFQIWARKEGILSLNVPEHGQFTARVREAALPQISIRRRGNTGNWFHGVQLTGKMTAR